MNRGTVFVSEQFDDDMDLCTGLWSAHWQSGDQWREGPECVSAEEAIAWGCQQADVVIVQPADGDLVYSAGTLRPPPDETSDFPPWPKGKELARRRPAGMEYLDRGHDDGPILWHISSGGSFPAHRLADFVRAYATSLRSDDAIEAVLVAHHAAGLGRYECEFTVLAATADEAETKALEATNRAFEAAFGALPQRGVDRLARLLPIAIDTYIHAPIPANGPADAAS